MPNDPRITLEQLCLERGTDYSTLSRFIDKNPAYIQQYLKRGTPKTLGERERGLIARFFDIDEEKLGGPPGRGPARKLVSVARRPVRAAAGDGQLADGEAGEPYLAFSPDWLRRLTSSGNQALSIITVEGDSMAPTLASGDDILVDEGDAGERLRDGIYVLRIDGALVVKRVALHPMGRKVTIQSDNPAYADWPDMALSDIDPIGRVIWSGRRIS